MQLMIISKQPAINEVSSKFRVGLSTSERRAQVLPKTPFSISYEVGGVNT
jgi:hypothetical protein